jgi:hypothetical protein
VSPSFGSARGIVAAAGGDFASAEQHHEAALAISNDPRYQLTGAVARFWYADMFRLRDCPGDAARARNLYAEAGSLAESLGLAVYARLAHQRSV